MKLLFIPGAGHNSSVWYYQTNYFNNAESVDLPGHPEGEPCVSLEEYAQWLRRYIIDSGLDDIVLIGHSMGGAVSITYALRYPDTIRGLVLIGTVGKSKTDPKFLQIIEQGITEPDIWLNTFVKPHYTRVDPSLRDRIVSEVAGIGASVQLNDFKCCDNFNILDEVHRIKVPVLIICGGDDRMTPAKYSGYLAQRIPDAQIVIIEDGSHVVFMEKPEAVNSVIARFLYKLDMK
jgi:pimeloyl-ACP methyl ester carboxylesterase